MKKMFVACVMSVMACGFMSCGDSKSSSTEQGQYSKEDATQEVVEKAPEDTANEVVRGDAEAEGFGRCMVSGCYCKDFEGRGQTCRNCGHAYKKHY